jgi:hypothetical protein
MQADATHGTFQSGGNADATLINSGNAVEEPLLDLGKCTPWRVVEFCRPRDVERVEVTKSCSAGCRPRGWRRPCRSLPSALCVMSWHHPYVLKRASAPSRTCSRRGRVAASKGMVGLRGGDAVLNAGYQHKLVERKPYRISMLHPRTKPPMARASNDARRCAGTRSANVEP